ncbi:hypothetical protein M407DRAFT_12864, partial [Tulasnella calospora MUT 4182]
MLRPVRLQGEALVTAYPFSPISMQTARITHLLPNALTVTPYNPSYAQSKVAKRCRGREIQELLNSSNTKTEDNWISWNNPAPRDRFNVTLHAETDQYRVYDWVAERTSILPVDFSVTARKVADDYLAQRRLDFCTGTLNSEKTFQSARNRILHNYHLPRYYWFLSMPNGPGYQWDVERGSTQDQLVIVDKRRIEDLPEAQRPFRLTYSTLLNNGFDEVIWAQACIMEYNRILLGALLGAPYPLETRYRNVNQAVDPRSGARWSIVQPVVGYWRITDKYLNAVYQLSRADATNPAFRISSWIANEISTCYYKKGDMITEY